MLSDDSMTAGRPLRTCPICRSTFATDSVSCWLCGAIRPRGSVEVVWSGGSGDEREAAREILDLEINSATFYGSVSAVLVWVGAEGWRVESATISRADAESRAGLPSLTDGRRRVAAGLEAGGLRVVEDGDTQ